MFSVKNYIKNEDFLRFHIKHIGTLMILFFLLAFSLSVSAQKNSNDKDYEKITTEVLHQQNGTVEYYYHETHKSNATNKLFQTSVSRKSEYYF